MHCAKHGNHILSNVNALTEPDTPEHAHQVVVNIRIVIGRHVTEKVDHVMLSFGRYVRISKEHHNIASRLPFRSTLQKKQTAS